jgi:hypothetical protein
MTTETETCPTCGVTQFFEAVDRMSTKEIARISTVFAIKGPDVESLVAALRAAYAELDARGEDGRPIPVDYGKTEDEKAQQIIVDAAGLIIKDAYDQQTKIKQQASYLDSQGEMLNTQARIINELLREVDGLKAKCVQLGEK